MNHEKLPAPYPSAEIGFNFRGLQILLLFKIPGRGLSVTVLGKQNGTINMSRYSGMREKRLEHNELLIQGYIHKGTGTAQGKNISCNSLHKHQLLCF